MTSPIAQIAGPIQANFVDGYMAWIREMRTQFPMGAPEFVFQASPNANLMRRLYRVDFAASAGDQPDFREMRLKNMLGFEPWTGVNKAAELHVSAFRWDCAVITVEGGRWDDVKLLAWFDKWFGVIGGQPAAHIADRPGGRLHAVTMNGASLHVDFGSASVEALEELVNIADEGGATRISIRDELQQVGSPA